MDDAVEQMRKQCDDKLEDVFSQMNAPKLKVPLTPEEGMYLVDLKQKLLHGGKMQIRKIRRQLRYKLFRIREDHPDSDIAIKKFIEAQFKPPMKWENFTFEWDLGANDPLMIVTQYTWVDSGGRFEEMAVMCEDGRVRQQKICSPTAFTQQEI